MDPQENYNWRRVIFLILGFISLVGAYIGILLPGIPAIPFILLAAWFFLQSSEKLYAWMQRQKIIGPIMKNYLTPGKIPNSTKWFVISQLWVSLVIAQVFFIRSIEYFILINLLGIACSVFLYKIIR